MSLNHISEFEKREISKLSREIAHLGRLSSVTFVENAEPLQSLKIDKRTIRVLNINPNNKFDVYLQLKVILK